jgi:membrane-bound lytic murein transglycosylase D
LSLAALLWSAAAMAEESSLRIERGARAVTSPPPQALGVEPEKKVTPAPSHKRGPRPTTPAPTLPEDVPLGVPSENARRAIAEGEPLDQLAKVAPDAQLLLLKAAEQVLFPEPVRGIEPGWSFALPQASAQSPAGLGLPLVDPGPTSEALGAPEDMAWLRKLTLPDLPVRLDRRVVTYLKFYRDSPRGRTIAAIFARKRGRYTAAMKAAFRRAGLPSDLVWLSMIESGHNPTITSPAGAVGLWQFMPESGRMYGLTVDRWVDERRDPARSTQAAIHFLSDLYQRFGNWELAMAAYNMGYAGMSRAIAKYNTNDYWALSRLESGIPWETTLYVPKIFALAVVMNNPREFGLSGIKPDASVSFDSILVEPGTTLSAVAQAAGVRSDAVSDLNPQYVAGRVPPLGADQKARRFTVAVPQGKGPVAAQKLARSASRNLRTVTVRFGDQLETLAAAYGVSKESLERENGLSDLAELEPSTVLILPPNARKTPQSTGRDAIVVSRKVQAGEGQKLVLYDVAPGDDLAEIAAAFGVTEGELARDNALDKNARLRPGMTLQVVVPEDRSLEHVRHQVLQGDLARLVLVSGSPEFHEYFEGLKGKHRRIVTVKRGETLSGIGSRYGMSVGSMERVNRRSRKSPLLPGEQLVVYTERGGKSDDGLVPEPLRSIKPPRPDLLPSAQAEPTQKGTLESSR